LAKPVERTVAAQLPEPVVELEYAPVSRLFAAETPAWAKPDLLIQLCDYELIWNDPEFEQAAWNLTIVPGSVV
jgi:hypothetical protein